MTMVVVSHELSFARAAADRVIFIDHLTLGAAAYLVLFVPFVVVGRWVETRFAWKR